MPVAGRAPCSVGMMPSLEALHQLHYHLYAMSSTDLHLENILACHFRHFCETLKSNALLQVWILLQKKKRKKNRKPQLCVAGFKCTKNVACKPKFHDSIRHTEASKFKLREVIHSVCCACTMCEGKGSDLCACVKANAEGTAMPLTFFPSS